MRAFLRIVLFLLIGPLVGLFTVSLTVGVWTLVAQGSLRDFTSSWDLLAPGVLIIAYMVGWIPALLTAVASVFIARWRSGVIGWLATAGVGLVISLLAAWLIFGTLHDGTEGTQITVMLMLAGAASGFICAALFDGIGALFGKRPAPV